MFKTTIIAVMLMMMSLSAGAGNSLMKYEDFVHLSDLQKDAYVIKLMELTVELESKYKHETAQYGYSKERFERYSKVLRSLKSIFFIDSAYAEANMAKPPVKNSDMRWERLAENFSTLMNYRRENETGKPNDNCIFAGWVSRVVYIKNPKTGKMEPTCAHPDFIDGTGPQRNATKMAPETKGYPVPNKDTTCSKDDKTRIQCSPVIFGYKSIERNSLFCVEARDGAKNSSFECMKSALEDGEEPGTADDPRPIRNSRENRLKDLRNRLTSNPNVFRDVWEFTYKTCVCPKVSATAVKNTTYFSQDYQNHIRPHRTCYGLMEMMGATALECSSVEPKLPLQDTKIFKDLHDLINRNEVSEQDADKKYSDYLNTMNSKKSAEYVRICGGEVTPEDPKPKVYTCSGQCDPTPADPTKFTCKYTIANEGNGADLEGEATGPEPKKDVPQVDVKFKLKGSTEEKTTKCDLTFNTPETPAGTYTCAGDCTPNAADATKFTCAYTISGSDGKPVELEAEATGPEPKADMKEVEVKFKLKGKPEEKSSKCNLTFKPVEKKADEDAPTLDTELICKETDTSCVVKAKWEKKEGWVLSWKTKDVPSGVTVKEGWKEAPSTGSTTPGLVVTNSPSTASTTPAATPESTTQAKMKDKYKVCGQLIKGEHKSNESCKEIPALKAVADKKPDAPKTSLPAGGPQMPMQPPVQIRGASDTSAIGIK